MDTTAFYRTMRSVVLLACAVHAAAAFAVNTAPVLNPGASPVLNSVIEDAAAPVGAVGTLVNTLVDFSFPFGQVDNVADMDAGALLGVAITAASTSGTWYYSINNGTAWTALGAVSNTNARLLAADAATRVYFQPNPNFSGALTNALTMRAWDQTSGANGGLASTAVNGGTSAFSTATDGVPITVTGVNDAPILDPTKSPTITLLEDAPSPVGPVGTLVSALVDFAIPTGQVDNITDVDQGALLGIAITTANTTNGIWYFSIDNGAAWTALDAPSSNNARLLAADAGSRLYFEPLPNFNGTLTALIIRAWDRTSGMNGGTANTSPSGGATAFSASGDGIILVVSPMNEAPVLDPSKNPHAQGFGYSGPPSGFNGSDLLDVVDYAGNFPDTDNASDIDGNGPGVAFTSADPSYGLWYFTLDYGVSWQPFPEVSDTAALLLPCTNATKIYLDPFVPYGFHSNALTFRAWDRTSGVNGGTANTIPNGGSTAFSEATDGMEIWVMISVSYQLSARLYLEGPFDSATGLMSDSLRTRVDFPLTEPYTALGLPPIGTGHTIISTVLATTGPNAIVDWVLVELRDNGVGSTVIRRLPALLQRDGDVVALDGVSGLPPLIAPGEYHVGVRHRNHLGCMSADNVHLTTAVATIDFTSLSTVTYGTDARKSVAGTFMLRAGDVTCDGALQYTGLNNDRDPILTTVGGTTPNSTVGQYSTRDVNMDGQVRYTGLGNDRDPILVNVGSTSPNNVRLQQLP